MHLTVRSQLLAGVASVAVVGSMVAVAPVVPKLDLPDIQSTMFRTTALSGLFVENALIIVGGFAASYGAINATLPNALAAPGQVAGGFRDHPDQIPVIVNDVFRGFDTQITGVSPVERPEPGTHYSPDAQNPGYYAPTDGTPEAPSVLAGPVVAADEVAQNLVDAHVPGAHTIQAATVSTRKVGVTVVQAQGLVRTSAYEAVQGVYGTAYNGGTPKQVLTATQGGIQHVAQSIVGAPVGTVEPDHSVVTAGSVKNLGAARSIAKSAADSVKAVGTGIKKDVAGEGA